MVGWGIGVLLAGGATGCTPGGDVIARVVWLDGSNAYACRSETMDDCLLAFLEATRDGAAVVYHQEIIECDLEGPVPIAELSAGALQLEPLVAWEEGGPVYFGEGPPDGFGTVRLFASCIPGFPTRTRATLSGAEFSSIELDVSFIDER